MPNPQPDEREINSSEEIVPDEELEILVTAQELAEAPPPPSSNEGFGAKLGFGLLRTGPYHHAESVPRGNSTVPVPHKRRRTSVVLRISGKRSK